MIERLKLSLEQIAEYCGISLETALAWRNSPHIRKALIVDDDANMARSIARALRRCGFETLIARDSLQASALLGCFCPDLITLDIKMPGPSGIEFIKLIRNTEFLRDIKILTISALPRQELAVSLKAGADDMLMKPYANESLIRKTLGLCRADEGPRAAH